MKTVHTVLDSEESFEILCSDHEFISVPIHLCRIDVVTYSSLLKKASHFFFIQYHIKTHTRYLLYRAKIRLLKLLLAKCNSNLFRVRVNLLQLEQYNFTFMKKYHLSYELHLF